MRSSTILYEAEVEGIKNAGGNYLNVSGKMSGWRLVKIVDEDFPDDDDDVVQW